MTTTTARMDTDQDTTTKNLDVDLLLDIALEADGFYEATIESYVVPMYAVNNMPRGCTRDDIAAFLKCPYCGEVRVVLQQSVDAILMDNYNMNNKGDSIIGICAECGTAESIEKELQPYL